jgi:protein O-mannosyl-transferase
MILFSRKMAHVALVVIVGLIIYARTLHAPFVLDDYGSIVNNPLITNLAYFYDLNSGKMFYGFGGFVSRYFGYLTFALNYRIDGLHVTGYHLVNIAIHLAASLFVYRLVSLTFRTPYFLQARDQGIRNRAGFIALIAALLFVSHPIQTQAVTYLVQRLASLASLLYLISLTCYIRARLTRLEPGSRGFSGAAWFVCALVSAVLAMKTKEISFTLPLTLLLYEALFFTGASRRKLVGALAFLVLAGSVGTLSVVRSGRSFGEIITLLDKATRLQTDMSRWDYLATQCRVIVTYLRLVIFPVGQRLDYDYPIYSFLNLEVLLSAALLGSLLAAAFYCLHRSRHGKAQDADDASALLRVVAFGIFWFFITLSVESSIIPIVDVIFEHRMYLPSAGLFMAAAAALSLAGGACAALSGWPKIPVLIGSAGVVLLLSGMTIARNELWRNEVALWEDNAWRCPQKARTFLNLGSAAERAGDLAVAEAAYREASDISSDQSLSRLDLGRLYLQWNRPDDALKEFREALAIDPGLGEAHNNIGKIFESRLQYDEALKEYLQAVKAKPYLAVPYCNIGYLYARQKRYAEALQEYEKAIVRDPDYEQVYINRGIALLATGRRSEALADFRRALQINPSSAEALQQLQLVGSAR